MIDPVLEIFIRDHLYNELRWLLVAAASWKVKEEDAPAAHFHVLCMDSAFLHARSLHEFFTMSQKRHEQLAQHHKAPVSCHSFGVERARSPFFDEWKLALDARLMHLRTDRSWLKAKSGAPARMGIKRQVLHVAQEILRLWDEFAADPAVAPYSGLLAEIRAASVADAEHSARKLGIASPFC